MLNPLVASLIANQFRGAPNRMGMMQRPGNDAVAPPPPGAAEVMGGDADYFRRRGWGDPNEEKQPLPSFGLPNDPSGGGKRGMMPPDLLNRNPMMNRPMSMGRGFPGGGRLMGDGGGMQQQALLRALLGGMV